MWFNYLSVGLRAMRNNRMYTAINVAGLAIGIAAAILILLYVRYETSYDRWLPDSERIYQFQSRIKVMGPEPVDSVSSPRVAVDAMVRAFPQIEAMTAATSGTAIVKVAGEPLSKPILFADPGFFELLKLPFVLGDARTALGGMAGLIVTEREAHSLFGAADPLGRTVDIETDGRRRLLRVTGVLADLPANTHLSVALIARFNPAEADPAAGQDWGNFNSLVYARLKPGATADEINSRMRGFEKRNLGPMDGAFEYRLAPILGIHMAPPLQGATGPAGDPLAVKAFSAIAALVLLIACFNFTNLSTAQASRRAREVGLRKALGASRRQLIQQFMAEAMMYAALGTVGGLVLVELLLPFFNDLLQLQLGLGYFGADGVLIPALALTLLVGTVSGLYPAIYLSGFRPGRVLGASSLPGASGSGRLRQALVVAQFAVAIALMICAAIVYAQTLFARNSDPGFRPRGLLAVENLSAVGAGSASATLREEIGHLPVVVRTSLAAGSPTSPGYITSGVTRPGVKGLENMQIASIDYGLLATMGIPVIAGRDFSPAMAADTVPPAASLTNPASAPATSFSSLSRYSVLLNQAAVRRLGFSNAESALGKEVILPRGRGDIVGIVGDVRFGSLRDQVAATIYVRDEAGFNHLLIRYSDTDPAALIRALKRVWRSVAGNTPFSARFVEDALAEHYDADAKRGQVFALAAALAIVIACLGLFGLAAFTVERRKLEIAIRKVFGARDRDIAALMVVQFSRPVLAANLIAWPVAWWLMRDWLNGFSERIDLHPGWFVAAGVLALLTAALTISGHALRVARTRPAMTLRNE
jgi:putative ABC transport system permease protein